MADNASERFGGEAILPLQYFRRLRARGVDAWLLTHARVREELAATHPELISHIFFIEDTAFHRALWRVGTRLDHRLRNSTTEFVSRLMTQLAQRRKAREIIRQHGVNVIHQPTPVSPREPSLIHGLEVPVICGPMNCATDFPRPFKSEETLFTRIFLRAARSWAPFLSYILPGKRRAAVLLVANNRTRAAVAEISHKRTANVAENGVDLDLWRPRDRRLRRAPGPCRFAFVGGLVRSKGLHLWLDAVRLLASEGELVTALIIGEGPERRALERQAHLADTLATSSGEPGKVSFAGQLHQADVARVLADQDAFVFPTLCECGGAAVLEAMALRLPVIATNWGGPGDYLDPTCGILVKPAPREEFVADIAAAMRRLAHNPKLRDEMGAAGRKKVERFYNWETKLDLVLHHYREAL